MHRRPRRTLASLVRAALLLAAAVPSCRRGPPEPPPPEIVLERELGAAYFAEDRLDEAQAELRKVLEWDGAGAQDYVNLACVELARSHFDEEGRRRAAEETRRLLERALDLDADFAPAWYCLGVLARRAMKPEEALSCFRRVLEQVPDDPAALLLEAVALKDLGRDEEAEAALREVQKRGVEFGGSFYVSAIYRLSQMLIRTGTPERVQEGLALQAEKRRLEEQGIKGPTLAELDRGILGRVTVPEPRPTPGRPAAGEAVTFERVGKTLFGGLGGVRDARAFDLDGDGDLDLAAVGPKGAADALRGEDGTFEEHPVATGDFRRVLVTDLDNDGRASLLLLPGEVGGTARLLTRVETAWRDDTETLGDARGWRAAVFVDLDHEGDLDLIACTDRGVRVLRNDGAPKHPAPVVLSALEDAPWLPRERFDWVAILDADRDQDVDLLCGGADTPTVLLSNLRKGRFERIDGERLGLPTLPLAPALGDLDHDGFDDLAGVLGGALRTLRNRGDGTFEERPVAVPAGGAVALEDLDRNGELDLVWADQEGAHAALGGLFAAERPPVVDLGFHPPREGPPEIVDLDGDGDLDGLALAAEGLREARQDGPPPRDALRIVLQGRKDNRPAVGAVVEVRAGPLYLHRFCTRPTLALGLGGRDRPDVVRVTWPNGVVQHAIRPPAGEPIRMLQKEGLVGSCPFLYTWNGRRFEFLSDVLGATPLGLPVADGVYVKPASREWVRIPGDRLAPREGFYELAITEELREATYLDRARLIVVDHDGDVEVHPEERFCLPPFPPKRLHAMRRILPVAAAIGSDGRDWTEAVAREDDVCARPFRPLSGQFLGLATPHYLEVRLPEEARRAERVRLLLTGWVFWTDASVNVAAARHPSISFELPRLLVPDGRGGFRESGPPIGFPAGKTKTMVLDVTDRLVREDLRVRIATTMRLYWDRIRVALDEEDAPVAVTELRPASAILRYRGFSAPIDPGTADVPERFDYERLRPPPWNQHEGMLTRYGEVRELLLETDDRFCLFSAGDEVILRFPARLPPPRPGRARTFLLDLEGWAKDGDPNSSNAGRVEPLPFHGMSGYPYGPRESYPDDEAHRRYLRTWNTRPGRRLLPDLAAPGAGAGRPIPAARTLSKENRR